jgi:uncharacterized protein
MTPAKRKKITVPEPDGDTKVAAILLGLFVGALIIFFIFSKFHHPRHPNQLAAKPVVYQTVQEHPSEAPAQVQAPPETSSVPGSGGKIAIIIDDWGQTTWNCKYLRDIPEPLAVSILPGLRHTKDVAQCAQAYHKLAMLHLPLEALHNYDIYPPNYIIKTTMSPSLVSKIVDEDLNQLPSIAGVNNHMGSKATEDRALMKLIFKKIKRKGLFFVDSMTAPHTVCASLAYEMDLPFGKRDVFLDNINTRQAITKQLMALARIARRRGYAVAIGHDRRLTMQVIKDEIPVLEAQGFQIVSIKDLLRNK